MLMWLYQVLAPAVLIRHVALFLLVAAMAMPTVAMLRMLALASGIVAIVLTAFVAFDPVGLFWSILLVLVLVYRMVKASSRLPGRSLSDDERFFHQTVVPTLTPAQVRKLLTAGRWRDVPSGGVLTRQGQPISELSFVLRGTVDIVVDGAKVAACGPGSLIGEVGLSTGEPATANAVTATPVRYLGFPAKRLYRLLDGHVDLQDAIELAIQRSIRDKLHRSNLAAAHPDATPA